MTDTLIPSRSTRHLLAAPPEQAVPSPGGHPAAGRPSEGRRRMRAAVPSAPSRSTAVPIGHTLTRLQVEWQRLSRSRESLARARSWGVADEPIGSLDDLLRLAGYGVSRRGDHDDDAVLGALVTCAHSDELAARVVLQRILPGIAAMGRRPTYVARVAATDDLLVAAWTVIRTYPIDRRPHHVAAGLLRSIGYAAVDPMSRRRARFVSRPTDSFDLTAAIETPPDAASELAELLDLAVGAGVPDDDVELMRRLGAGASTAELAAERHVTDRTIRNRRAAAAHRLRAVAWDVA